MYFSMYLYVLVLISISYQFGRQNESLDTENKKYYIFKEHSFRMRGSEEYAGCLLYITCPLILHICLKDEVQLFVKSKTFREIKFYFVNYNKRLFLFIIFNL